MDLYADQNITGFIKKGNVKWLGHLQRPGKWDNSTKECCQVIQAKIERAIHASMSERQL